MCGSSAYTLLLAAGKKAEDVLKICLVVITLCMLICAITGGPEGSLTDIVVTYLAFLFMEFAFGMYFPAASYLKYGLNIKLI